MNKMRAPNLPRDPSLLPAIYSSILLLVILLIVSVGCQLQSTQAPANNSQLPIATDHHHGGQARLTFGETIKSIWDDKEKLPQSRCESVAAGFLLGESTDLHLNLSDPLDLKLSQILDRDGPDMRPSRDYNDFKDITMDVAKRAWWLLHEHTRHAISDRAELSYSALEKLMREAKVSTSCMDSVHLLFVRAKEMDSWAIRLMNSWGTFPMGAIYEGTYGSVGAFHTCLDIEENNFIGHAHYCSVAFRPLMPSQRDYELIVRKEPAELRQMFEKLRYDREERESAFDAMFQARIITNGSNYNLVEPPAAAATNPTTTSTTKRPGPRLDYRTSSTDAFTDIIEHAQYHHFLNYKVGTCWPIACSPFDVRRVSKLFARKSILLNGPVKCYSKFENDYEQPDEVDDALHEPASAGADGAAATGAPAPANASAAVHGTTTSNHTARTLNTTTHTAAGGKGKGKGRKLVISVWDKNNGIFIWKPHFTKAHKIALSIVALVTAFIGLMTLIDICFVRLPPLFQKFVLSLKGMPLDFYDSPARGGGGGGGGNGRADSFKLRTNSDERRPAERVSFALVPSSADEHVLPDAFHPATLVEGAGSGGRVVSEDELAEPAERDTTAATLPRNTFWGLVDDCSAITNFSSFFRVSEGQMRNDILCLNGIRCITMIWIIMTHTMMYNDWSAFARTRAIEIALESMLLQPLFNGSYLVDTFFLMSGLLSAFTAFRHCQGKAHKFNSLAFIFGRWLRLTPQIFLVSMIFIFFPTLSYGPHWYPIVGEYSENCVKNWWINVLHLQAFYKKEEMCNFVTWWISIDFFYHFFALAVIWVILAGGHKLGSTSIATIISGAVMWQSYRHHDMGLPPNVFSTIPQTGAMWTKMTLSFFWTPYTHSIPFFFGFYIGYLMALKRKLIVRSLNTRRALIGWILAVGSLVGQSYSTYWWVTGQADYSRPVSTLFFGACSFIWAGSLCWIILACQHGYGGFVNRVLSWKVFIVLGKSSYLIYLSHFMVLFMYFGNQNIFLEPSPLNMAYIVVGNILISTILGIVLCSFYEIPWLKMHRRLMKYV